MIYDFSLFIEDSCGNVVHPMARRLGSVSGRNNSRDWWRALNGGPVSWYGWYFFWITILSYIDIFYGFNIVNMDIYYMYPSMTYLYVVIL